MMLLKQRMDLTRLSYHIRPDDVFKVGDPAFTDLLQKKTLSNYDTFDFIEALYKRIQYFHDKGGRLATMV